MRTVPSRKTSWSPSIIWFFASLYALKLAGSTANGVGVPSAHFRSVPFRIQVDEANALALLVWSKCRWEKAM